MAVLLSGDGMRGEQGGSRETGQRDPPAPWVAFVGASPRRFAPLITTVPAEGPSAEWFDRSLPRHPPEGRTWRLSYTTATPLSSCRRTLLPGNGLSETPLVYTSSGNAVSNLEGACL